jgi:DNA-binding FadR family transcriptional regulator
MTEQTVPRLQRKTLAQQAAENLVEFIERQRLAPGSILPSEGQLATQLGVSRPILREALRTLEATGVVEVVNGKGAIVKPLTGEVLTGFFYRAARSRREAILEILELRKGIEVQAATLAAERRTAEDIDLLRDKVGQMRRHCQNQDVYGERDIELHLLIARASGNTILFHLVESLRGVLEEANRERHLLRPPARPELMEETQQSHERIVESIAAGDAAAAAAAMACHFDVGVQLLDDV